MDWMQVFFLFLANAVLITWFRTESRNDWKHMDAKMDANRQETSAKIDAIHQEMKDFHNEIKNFHGRLCAIEERRLAMGK